MIFNLDKIKETYNANNSKPWIFVLVGLPSSGKSTIADEISGLIKNTIVVSSDEIRQELFGDNYVRSIKTFETAKERIYKNADELKNCFRQNSSKEAIEKFKNYLKNYHSIPEVLRQFIHKHVLNHFKRYIEYLDDENIEKTSNKVENYYRQTNPEKIKKIYKTKTGILTFLDYQMENWTKNHLKIK